MDVFLLLPCLCLLWFCIALCFVVWCLWYQAFFPCDACASCAVLIVVLFLSFFSHLFKFVLFMSFPWCLYFCTFDFFVPLVVLDLLDLLGLATLFVLIASGCHCCNFILGFCFASLPLPNFISFLLNVCCHCQRFSFRS